MQIIVVVSRTTTRKVIIEKFWKGQNEDLKKIQILMQGISIWIKIDEARLELNGENSIYGSRKAVGCFMINCDCKGCLNYIYK